MFQTEGLRAKRQAIQSRPGCPPGEVTAAMVMVVLLVAVTSASQSPLFLGRVSMGAMAIYPACLHLVPCIKGWSWDADRSVTLI